MIHWRILIFLILSFFPLLAVSIGHNAFHRFEPDSLSGADDAQAVSSGTEYTPDISAVPANRIVDGITLRITFGSGEEVNTDRLLEVSCRGYRTNRDFTITNEQMRFSVRGRDLVAYYGFVDVDNDGDGEDGDRVLFNNTDCWRFVVSGTEPLTRAEVFISYHAPNEDNMPDLYSNRVNLLKPIYSLTDPDSMLEGLEVPNDVEKLIILVHGWNPSARKNHFASDLNKADDEPTQWKWSDMASNLLANPAVERGGWTVALYDWSRDASTGQWFSEPIDNPNASRDAAHAHGLRLGNMIAEGRSIKEVHFVAHSAGNWAARRAAERLRHIYGSSIRIQITSLDPFVNGDDAGLGDDPDLVPDFELMRQWIDYLDNFYVIDFATDKLGGVGWTSGEYLGWNRNLNIETLGPDQLYIADVMDSHAGPVLWYAQTTVAALDVEITASPDPVGPGERVYYAMTASNVGSKTLTGVVLDAQVPDYGTVNERETTGDGDCFRYGGTCSAGDVIRWQLGDLTPGESRTVQMAPKLSSGSYAPPDGSLVSKPGSIYYYGWGAYRITDVAVDATPVLSLSLEEDHNPVRPNELLTYTLDAWNRGAIDVASGVLAVSVPQGSVFVGATDGGLLQDGEVRWTLGALPASGRQQRRFTVRVDAGAGDGELLVTQAEARGVVNSIPVAVAANAAVAVQASPDLLLSMTASPDPVGPGERVYYAMTASNVGSKTLTGVVLDALVPDYGTVTERETTGDGECFVYGGTCTAGDVIRWQLGDLPPGASRTVQMAPKLSSGSYAPPDGTLIRGEATVSYAGGAATAARDVVVDATPVLLLSLEEDHNPVRPNELLTYTLDAWNRGAIDVASGVLAVSVPQGSVFVGATDGGLLQDGEVRWTLGALPASGRQQRRFTVRVDAGAGDGELLVTQAEARGVVNSIPVAVAANAAVAVQASPDLLLSMTASPDPVGPGERVYYAMTASNVGSKTLTGVVLDALVPDYGTVTERETTGDGECFVYGGTCTAGDVIRWQLGDLPPGASRTVQMAPKLSSGSYAPPDGTLIRGEATVSYAGGAATAARDVVVDATPVLLLSLEEDHNPVRPNELLTYTLDAWNRGAIDVASGVLAVSVPQGSVFVGATDGGLLQDGEVRWTLGALPASGRQQRRFTVRVDAGAGDGELLVTQAEARGVVNSIPVAVAANAAVAVQASPDLLLSMTASPDPVGPGERVYYAMTASNVGSKTLTGVVLDALVPDYGTVTERETTGDGECFVYGGTCTAGDVIRWQLGDLPPGASRTVQMAPKLSSGSYAPPDGTLIRGEATVSYAGGAATAARDVVVDATPVLLLSLEEDHNPVRPNELLTYTLDAWNRGAIDVASGVLAVSVPQGSVFVGATDGGLLQDGEVRWTLGALPASGRQQRRFTVRVDAGAGDGELLVTQAEARGVVNSIPVAVAANAAVAVQASPDLLLSMTASPDPVGPGERVYYAMTASNVGSKTLTGVVLDALVPDYGTVTERETTGDGECFVYGGTCTAGDVIRWQLGDLPPGASRTVQMAPKLSSGSYAPPDGTLIRGEATVSYAGGAATAARDVVVDATPVLLLSLEEDHNPVRPNELLTYTLDAWNRGAIDVASGVLAVSVPQGSVFVGATDGGLLQDGEVRWTLGALPASGRQQRRFTVRVDAGAGDGELLVTQAEARGVVNSIPVAVAANAAVAVQASPDLLLSMTASPDPVGPGERVYYAMTASNVGSKTLTGVVLDALVPDYGTVTERETTGDGECFVYGGTCTAGDVIRWQLGDLPPGASRTVQMAPKLSSGSYAPPDGTLIRGEATVSYAGGAATAARDVVVDATPVLLLSLEEDHNPVRPNELLTYTLDAWNRGAIDVASGVLAVSVPQGSVFVGATDGGLLQDGEVRWTLGALPASGRQQRRFTVRVDAGAGDGELLVTQAEARGVVNSIPVAVAANAAVAVQASPDLLLSMTASPDPVGPGERVYYAMTASNVGSKTLTGVVLDALVPDYGTVTERETTGDGECLVYGSTCTAGDVIRWQLGDLSPGASRTVQMAPKLSSGSYAPPDGTLIRGEATVSYVGGSATVARDVVVNIATTSAGDTDGDGIPDSLDPDDDGDLIPDTWEDSYGLNSLDPTDASKDLDRDGLTAFEEFLEDADPHDSDTDNDGIPDGTDANPLFPVPNQCSNDTVVIPNGTIYFNGDDFVCRAQESISIQGRVTVKPGAHVFFMSPEIKLGPGFRVEDGGKFQAVGATEVAD